MLALVIAASSSNHNTRVLALVICKKLKFVATTVYPNASGPGAATARANAGHSKHTATTALCPLVIYSRYGCTRHPSASGVTFPDASSATTNPSPFRLIAATMGGVPGDENGVPPVCF